MSKFTQRTLCDNNSKSLKIGSKVFLNSKTYFVRSVEEYEVVLRPSSSSLIGVVCRDTRDVFLIDKYRFVIPERFSADGRYMVRSGFVDGTYVNFGHYLRVINDNNLIVSKVPSFFRDLILLNYYKFLNK